MLISCIDNGPSLCTGTRAPAAAATIPHTVLHKAHINRRFVFVEMHGALGTVSRVEEAPSDGGLEAIDMNRVLDLCGNSLLERAKLVDHDRQHASAKHGLWLRWRDK